ncbi:cytochrome P450 [Parasphingorhabdus flavimaris]|jgi:cytochrome P450|uniref:Cytochrome P450 n=1 Tax=Parasphingorhabdus flavimaris TaxID=266812 RepID=A0ABX2MXT9_9SPHN|nr:cytochrome P450 [Parasphingorhabdus flavimaris]NVD26281.1 cytochrome P450 [Parasphingorhabdus flavimaris]
MQPAFDVDQLSRPEVIRNPYPYYDLLRDQSPIFGYRDYPPGTMPGVDDPKPSWVVLNFEDVAAVAWDHESFSSRDSLQEESSAPSLMLVNHDRPEHSRLRKIAAKAFQPSSIKSFAPQVDALVAACMDDFFVADQPVDVMADYCAMLPSRVMAHLFGMPAEMDRDVNNWATAFMLSADIGPEERQAYNVEAMAFFDTHVKEQMDRIAQGKEIPGPLLDAFIRTEVDGDRLSFEEIVRFCMTVTVAGAETTSFYLGNLITVFADFPDIWRTFADDPGQFDAIYKEVLRFHGPPQRLFRVATRDITIGKADIRRGDWVACFFGAANYDPDAFPNPYEFRLNRKNASRHMSFGYGIHRCLGAPLAQLEAESTARMLRERYRQIERAGEPVWQDVSLLNHGLQSNPVIFRARD